MNLNYKEKSLILAGLSELNRLRGWKLSLNLVDLQETLQDKDLEDLIEKVAGACHKDLDELKDPTIPQKHKEVDTRGLSPYAK